MTQKALPAIFWSFFSFGALLTLVMVNRAQMGGDELNLLARGYLLAKEGVLVPYGNPMSGGGKVPGPMTSIFIGLPLLAWFDHRAPQLLLWCLSIGSFFIFDHILSGYAGWRGRVAFAFFYWLSPWRVYHSVFLWNPSYLYFLGAIYLWTVVQLRRGPNLWASMVHVLSVGLALQFHGSAFILGILSILLLWFRYIRFSWSGFFSGCVLVLLSLAPWFAAVWADPTLLPGSKEGRFLGRGLIYVYPFVRGLMYLWRQPTFLPPSRVYRFDFRESLGEPTDAILSPVLSAMGYLLGCITLLLAIWGYFWLYTRAPLRSYFCRNGTRRDREWFIGVLIASQLAAVLSFAISPTGINHWQVLVLHAFVALSLAMFFEQLHLPQKLLKLPLKQITSALTLMVAVVLIGIAFGSPQYRRGGRGGHVTPLRNDHPMFHELKLFDYFEMKIYENGVGWWIDVLPDKHPPPEGFDQWIKPS